MTTVLQIAAMANAKLANAQAAVTNNLANASTTAFKADLYYAEKEYLGSNESGSSAVDFGAGNVYATGRDLDVAISGPGWMQVLTPTGEEVLSRRGDLRVDLDGRLVDGVGRQVMSETGPVAIQPDATSIAIPL